MDITSSKLRNVLGDQRLAVLLSTYQSGVARGERYPLLVDLAAFTNSSLVILAGRLLRKRCRSELIGSRKKARSALQSGFPETFTSLGGNQFVDSDAIGHWATWLHTDLISAIEANYPVRQAAFAQPYLVNRAEGLARCIRHSITVSFGVLLLPLGRYGI